MMLREAALAASSSSGDAGSVRSVSLSVRSAGGTIAMTSVDGVEYVFFMMLAYFWSVSLPSTM